MAHESSHFEPELSEHVRRALVELRNAGGDKRWIHCGFGYSTLYEAVKAGWATIDDGPTREAHVRLTLIGRIALVQGGVFP